MPTITVFPGSNREVIQGLQPQGSNVARTYSVDVSNVAGTPTGTPTFKVYDEKTGEDVTSTVVTGASSLSGSTITTGRIGGLTPNRTYYCLLYWSIGSSKVEDGYFRVRCEK